jgi:hypothetical protein
MKLARTCTLAGAFLMLSACSTEAPKQAEVKKQAEAPPEPITGQSAFFKMYAVARGWAPDCEGLVMRSIHLQGVPYVPGKAAAWEARFVSRAGRKARSYTYSAIEAEGNLHKGVFAGLEEGWSGPSGAQEPFNFQAVKKDTDAAYQTALAKGKSAKEYIKKNPDKQVFFILERPKRLSAVAWRVLWGESVSTSNYSVYVDASTGEYLETMR